MSWRRGNRAGARDRVFDREVGAGGTTSVSPKRIGVHLLGCAHLLNPRTSRCTCDEIRARLVRRGAEL